jgi:hypothetical protein
MSNFEKRKKKKPTKDKKFKKLVETKELLA